MKISDTLTNQKKELEFSDKVRIYLCGVTVYDQSHIGHARTIIVFDTLRRFLEANNIPVELIQNFTDIDDKIINRAKEQKESANALSSKYIQAYFDDSDRLNIKRATNYPKATEHIGDMIDLIQKLVENEFAYASKNGVYFHVSKFSGYGKLSKKKTEDLDSGSRIEIDESKENPLDFALWKFSDEQPNWESPWGKGRPGWHIECSAMSIKYLGTNFEIHGGGRDLIFPHHENELAQSCGASGEIENINHYAKCWLHNGMIKFDGDKMSKSLGNILYINDLLKKYDGEVLRLVLLSTHYRQPLNWSEKSILQSQKMLDRMYRVLHKISDEVLTEAVNPPKEIINALCDDLNTPGALGQLNILFNDFQHAKDDQRNSLLSKIISGANLLGILNQKPDNWLGYKNEIDTSDLIEIEKLIKARDKHRLEKNYKMSDQIRDELTKLGIDIEDSPQGTKWRKI